MFVQTYLELQRRVWAGGEPETSATWTGRCPPSRPPGLRPCACPSLGWCRAKICKRRVRPFLKSFSLSNREQNVEKAWKWSTPFNGGLLIVAVAVVGLIVFAFEGWSFAQFVSDYFGWKTFNVGKRQCDQMLDLKVVQILPKVAQIKSNFFTL